MIASAAACEAPARLAQHHNRSGGLGADVGMGERLQRERKRLVLQDSMWGMVYVIQLAQAQ